jgi:ribonuclease HI
MTKREVFSLCGRLVGHYPVVASLRPACSFIKRSTGDQKWDEAAPDRSIAMLAEVMQTVANHDPVRGNWSVAKVSKGRIWCDASSLAIGVCVEIDGHIVEDASWLRKPQESVHINLAELESIIKGLNLAIKWNITEIEVMTDSSTVHSWVTSMLTKDRRIKTHGMGEALVHRRLTLLADLIEECGLNVKIALVKSEQNLADKLTRVPKKWLQRASESAGAAAVVTSNTNGWCSPTSESLPDEQVQHSAAAVTPNEMEQRKDEIRRIHRWNHFGVDRTLYVVRRRHPTKGFRREEVEQIVRSCQRCVSVDPAPVQWEKGSLDVKGSWQRIACDVTFYAGRKFWLLSTVVPAGS